MNRRSPVATKKLWPRSILRMLRVFFLVLVTLVAAGPARAAGDIDTCRKQEAEPAARLAACETVIADDKITGKPRAGAFWFRGDSLMKKRDYDGAIAAFSAALDADPENAFYSNVRGLAYGDKGDDEHALADYEQSLKVRPNFASPYNNRGLIYLRKGDLDRAFEEFNAAIKFPANNTSRYIHLFNRARVQTYRKQYDAALADFAEAQKLNPEGPQVANYRCITYTEVKKFDEALADCNAALEKTPTSIYALTNRGNVYLAKGDLDAALKDYNEALKINPNYIRAHAYRGQLFEKRRDAAAARSDYRSASAALTKFDEFDTAIARRIARERLAVLTAAAPPSPPSGKASGKTAAP